MCKIVDKVIQSTMSEPNTHFDGNFLANTAMTGGQAPLPGFVPNTQMASTSAVGSGMPPPLPPRLDMSGQQAMSPSYGYGGMGMGGGYGMGMGGYGGGYGMGMGGYGGMGMGMGMGGMYGGYNRYGMGGAPMYGDIESRYLILPFLQIPFSDSLLYF